MKMPSQPPLCLLETMRWEHGIALLNRHLARSAAAAAALNFRFDESAIRLALLQFEASLDSLPRPASLRDSGEDTIYRLRLTLDKAGSIHVASTALKRDAVAFRTVALHTEPVDSTDRLRAFKTTKRDVYEAAYDLAKDSGFDEAILVNERGEVVEGTRTNLWVRRDGFWLTPPLSSGSLGGVYRAHMLETWKDASEAVLSVGDLVRAEQVGLSNAVHGFLPVVLETDS